MTNDWPKTCEIASKFHIEIWGKELWLVKHDTELQDCIVNGRNIPFRPHLLAAKTNANDQDLCEKFSDAVKRWA